MSSLYAVSDYMRKIYKVQGKSCAYKNKWKQKNEWVYVRVVLPPLCAAVYCSSTCVVISALLLVLAFAILFEACMIFLLAPRINAKKEFCWEFLPVL